MRRSAQSDIESQDLSLLIWKSPLPYGKRQGNARVKKYLVVNSDSGTSPLVGQGIIGIVTYFFPAVTGPCFSPTTCSTTLSTCSLMLFAGSGRVTQDTVLPSTSPGSTCRGAGPRSVCEL